MLTHLQINWEIPYTAIYKVKFYTLISTKVPKGVCLHYCLLWMQQLHLEQIEIRAVTTQGSLAKQWACISCRTRTLLTPFIISKWTYVFRKTKICKASKDCWNSFRENYFARVAHTPPNKPGTGRQILCLNLIWLKSSRERKRSKVWALELLVQHSKSSNTEPALPHYQKSLLLYIY